jgi:hypothetical protein
MGDRMHDPDEQCLLKHRDKIEPLMQALVRQFGPERIRHEQIDQRLTRHKSGLEIVVARLHEMATGSTRPPATCTPRSTGRILREAGPGHRARLKERGHLTEDDDLVFSNTARPSKPRAPDIAPVGEAGRGGSPASPFLGDRLRRAR